MVVDPRSPHVSDPLHAAWIAAARREAEPCRAWPVERDAAHCADNASEAFAAALPGYALGPEISRGGQGVVYRAVQRGTDREVAIKVLRAAALDSPAQQARFEREVRILAQLEHPNIVTILDSGTCGPRHYFIMRYISGQALDEYLRTRRPRLTDILRLFITICDAVSAAHLRGILHRDLKPGNIRVDPDGVPHVLDFGLAKTDALRTGGTSSNAATAFTSTGEFVGSLPWASPEQVDGSPDDLDIRTDVYSLGVMLYHALTGQHPYDLSGTFRETLNTIVTVEPLRPSSRNRALNDDLDTIVLKCLRKNRAERYDSASELRRELQRFLQGEPLIAKRDSTWYVLRKSIRRHRVPAVMAGLALALLISIGMGAVLLYRQEARLRGEAVAARDEARRQAHIAELVNTFLNDDLLTAARPEQRGRDVSLRELLDLASLRLGARLDGEPLIAARLHHTLGNTYFSLGVNDLAERHLGRALELFQLSGAESLALVARGDQARLWTELGRFEPAERLLRDILIAVRQTQPPGCPAELTALSNLGIVHMRLGRLEEAEESLRRALTLQESQRGAHAPPLNTMQQLGTLYRQRGRLAESEELLLRAAQTAVRLHGSEDPQTQPILLSLAETYRKQNRYPEAETLFAHGLSVRQRLYGAAHPNTLLLLNNLAVFYSHLHGADATEWLLREGLAQARPALGDQHPTVVSMFSNLGQILSSRHRHLEARPYHALAVENAVTFLPARHANRALYLQRYGECLLALGELSEAEAALLTAHSIRAALTPISPEDLRQSCLALAGLYESWSCPEQAQQWRAAAPID